MAVSRYVRSLIPAQGDIRSFLNAELQKIQAAVNGSLLEQVLVADANHFIAVQGAPLAAVGSPQLIVGTRAAPLVQPVFGGIYLSDPVGTIGISMHNVNAANTAVNYVIEAGNDNPGDALAGGITSSTYVGPYFSNMPTGKVCFLGPVTTGYTLAFGAGAKASLALGTVGTTPFLQGGAATGAGMVDLTPDYGTFTGTLTGCTAAVTQTFNWARIGKWVYIWLDGVALNGTSNANTMTVTGVPAGIAPFNNRQTTCYAVQDNTLTGLLAGVVILGNGGSGTTSLSFGRLNTATGQWQGNNWTAAGTKGLQPGFQISYML